MPSDSTGRISLATFGGKGAFSPTLLLLSPRAHTWPDPWLLNRISSTHLMSRTSVAWKQQLKSGGWVFPGESESLSPTDLLLFQLLCFQVLGPWALLKSFEGWLILRYPTNISHSRIREQYPYPSFSVKGSWSQIRVIFHELRPRVFSQQDQWGILVGWADCYFKNTPHPSKVLKNKPTQHETFRTNTYVEKELKL